MSVTAGRGPHPWHIPTTEDLQMCREKKVERLIMIQASMEVLTLCIIQEPIYKKTTTLKLITMLDLSLYTQALTYERVHT